MTAFKVFVYFAAGFGLMFLIAVIVGKAIALGNRAIPERTVPTSKPRYTVLWRENQYIDSAFTGTLEWLDYDRLLITDGDDAVLVERRNIKEMW